MYRKGLVSQPATHPPINIRSFSSVLCASSSEVKRASRVLTLKKKATPRGLYIARFSEKKKGMEKFTELIHLFVTVFLSTFASLMVLPAVTDVTMAAVCPGQDECSLAIYLTGFQQAVRYSLYIFIYFPSSLSIGEIANSQ